MSNQYPINPDYSGHQTLRGFTLIELMVTISLLAILLTIAVPSYNDATLGGKLSSYANNFVASAHLARSEAIKRNASVTLCVSTDGTSCGTTGGWEQGWIILSGTTVIRRQQAFSTGLKMTESSGARSISFPATGVGLTPAGVSLTVCRATPSAGGQERVVSISVTGRTTVTRTTAGICS